MGELAPVFFIAHSPARPSIARPKAALLLHPYGSRAGIPRVLHRQAQSLPNGNVIFSKFLVRDLASPDKLSGLRSYPAL
jgi:hypothetical protein